MLLHCHYGLKEDSSPYLKIFLDLYENLRHVATAFAQMLRMLLCMSHNSMWGIVHPCCTHGHWHWLSVGRRCALQPLVQLPRTLSANGNAVLTPRWHWHSARSPFMRWHNPWPCHLPPLTAALSNPCRSSAFKAAFSQCHQASERVALIQLFLNPLKELKSMQKYYTRDHLNYLLQFYVTERMRPSFIFKFCHYMAGLLCPLIITCEKWTFEQGVNRLLQNWLTCSALSFSSRIKLCHLKKKVSKFN